MRITASVRVDGLRELESALKELPKATARNVLRRALAKRGEPMAETMRQLAPDDPTTPPPDLKSSIFVGTRIKNKVGHAEYSAVLRAGGTKAQAGAALRQARKEGGPGSFAEVYVGPDSKKSFIGHFQEFGTRHHGPQPFMRPAWEQHKHGILDGLRDDLWREIDKAAKRLAKKAAKAAAAGQVYRFAKGE